MAEVSRSVVRPIPLSDKRPPADKTEVQVGSQGILSDNDGALWITTIGDGLRRSPVPELLSGRIEKFSTAVESFVTKDGLSDDYVRAILQAGRETSASGPTTAWIASAKRTWSRSFFKARHAVLAAGTAGDAWVENLDLGSVVHVEGTRAEPGDPMASVAPSVYRDPSAAIWRLSWDGIYRFDAGKYTRITLPLSFPRTYSSVWMGATEDGSGALWLTA